MQPIENFEAQTLKFALQDMISEEAAITTDHHRSYQNLKKEMNIETVLSNKGQSLEELHKQIMQFKNWLRGIHHKCSAQPFFAYVDEYFFRFNRRNNRKAIFHKVIDKMMNQIPHPYPIKNHFITILPNSIILFRIDFYNYLIYCSIKCSI